MEMIDARCASGALRLELANEAMDTVQNEIVELAVRTFSSPAPNERGEAASATPAHSQHNVQVSSKNDGYALGGGQRHPRT